MREKQYVNHAQNNNKAHFYLLADLENETFQSEAFEILAQISFRKYVHTNV